MAIKSWAEMGVDGIAILGLEQFSHDPYVGINAENWKVNFNKYSVSPYSKIMTASYLLPTRLDQQTGEAEAEHKAVLTGYQAVASFELLEATVKLGSIDTLVETVEQIAQWDHAPSQPWILWNLDIDGVSST